MLKTMVCRALNLSFTPKRLAGHSKWANIRHIKAEKDQQKSRLFDKITRRIMIAIQDGGGPNPATNSQLSQAIEMAKKNSMPNSTIEKAVKSAQVDKSKATSAWLEVKGPKGSIIIVSVYTSNLKRTKEGLASILRRNNGVWAEGVRHLFEGKGLVEAEGGREDGAEEAAILAGAEEVSFDPETKSATFVTAIDEVEIVSRKLGELGWVVTGADISWATRASIALSPTDLQAVEKLINKIEEHPDVVESFSNVES